MPTALVHPGVAVAVWLLGAVRPAHAQDPAGERLRKTDLVRLLANPTLVTGALAARIRRTCLTFTPTVRDRADFVALGADSSVLREIAACAPRPAALGVPARRAPAAAPAARTATTTSPPTRRATPAGAPLAPAAPGARAADAVAPRRPPPVSGVRTGFVLGVGQHATVGILVRQATLYAEAGPAARLVLRCGKGGITGRLGLAPGVRALLRVTAQDGFGNEARVTGLQVAAADRAVVRVVSVDTDSGGGVVRLAPGEEGSTSLVVAASAHART